VTALEAAARHAKPDVVRLLLSRKADIGATDSSWGTALHAAAQPLTYGERNEEEVARDLFRRAAAVARLLIDAGVDLKAEESGGRTALHQAAWHGNAEVAELLIAKGADVNARDRQGKRPLFYAEIAQASGTGRGGKAVVELLRKHGGVE
jgi:cytohesin